MGKIILGLYSSTTLVALVCAFLGAAIMLRCHKDKDYSSTFWMSSAVFGVWASIFLSKVWWSSWKAGYMSRDAVAWMLDHWFVAVLNIGMVVSGLITVYVLADNSPHGRLWKVTACTALLIGWLTYLVK